MELEQDGDINFLDITIKRSNNKFVTAVYRKPSAGTKYINSGSAHPWLQKMNIWKNFFRRAVQLSDLREDREMEIQYLIKIGQENGFQNLY